MPITTAEVRPYIPDRFVPWFDAFDAKYRGGRFHHQAILDHASACRLRAAAGPAPHRGIPLFLSVLTRRSLPDVSREAPSWILSDCCAADGARAALWTLLFMLITEWD